LFYCPTRYAARKFPIHSITPFYFKQKDLRPARGHDGIISALDDQHRRGMRINQKYAEVVKNALRIYEALIGETEEGKQLLTRDQYGVVRTFTLFL
jgi:hypothetical protein